MFHNRRRDHKVCHWQNYNFRQLKESLIEIILIWKRTHFCQMNLIKNCQKLIKILSFFLIEPHHSFVSHSSLISFSVFTKSSLLKVKVISSFHVIIIDWRSSWKIIQFRTITSIRLKPWHKMLLTIVSSNWLETENLVFIQKRIGSLILERLMTAEIVFKSFRVRI